jgi:hypothetical protein
MIEFLVGFAIWACLGTAAAVAVGRASAIGTPRRIPYAARLPRR